jgi:hypothetical protein
MKIDTGYKMPSSPCCEPAKPEASEEKTFYPSLYLRSEDKIALPEGKFRFVCEGKVISRTESTSSKGDEGPKESCSYDIEIYSIEPGKGSKDEGMVSLGDELKKAMRKKMGREEY